MQKKNHTRQFQFFLSYLFEIFCPVMNLNQDFIPIWPNRLLLIDISAEQAEIQLPSGEYTF